MRSKRGKAIALFLAPAVVLYALFFLFPLGYVFFISFIGWSGASPRGFVGLQNYIDIFLNPTFAVSVRNNIVWALSLGIGQISLAALVAMILARGPRGWRFLRTVYFLPNVISQVAISMMWLAIYNAEHGALNRILEALGWGHLARNWLGLIETALPAIIIQQVLYIGYFMIVILASTMSIPASYYEAARIDGANVFQQERFITLPLIRGVLVTASILAMAYGLRHFEATFLMTAGGPANSTSVMGIMLFNNLHFLQYGRANSIGAVLIALGALIIAIVRRAIGRAAGQMEDRQ